MYAPVKSKVKVAPDASILAPHSRAIPILKPARLPPLGKKPVKRSQPAASSQPAKVAAQRPVVQKQTAAAVNVDEDTIGKQHGTVAIVEQQEQRQSLPEDDENLIVVVPPLSQSLQRIHIQQLVQVLTPIVDHPVCPFTPLILDRSKRVELFFRYSSDFSALFIYAKKHLLETIVHKKCTMPETLEALRCTLVNAMRYGRTLVIDMADTATDFLHKFTSPTEFPAATVMAKAGRDLYLADNWSKVVREDDKENGIFVVREGFRVIITSVFTLEDYEEFLKDAIPMEETLPVYIEPEKDHDSG
ncbi:hypothetical protein DFS34DRAFT_593273 [Phlyctochytrium arcticum]|nr:hypothetical protein DFS34DRAFT_593273 [Phlyctochytrium arcticum]